MQKNSSGSSSRHKTTINKKAEESHNGVVLLGRYSGLAPFKYETGHEENCSLRPAIHT